MGLYTTRENTLLSSLEMDQQIAHYSKENVSQKPMNTILKNLTSKPLLLIVVLAFFLRVINLTNFPFGFHADEARVGWNALSIAKTGKDDRGNALAVHYNTFGDYRPTGIFYLTLPSIIIFGRNEFAVRFPSALLGALTILPLFFFVLEITKKKNLALLSALLLAISPWHIATSRATSEVVIALFLVLFGLFFLLKGFREKSNKLFFASLVFLVLSYFFYHSARILVPLFVGALIIYFWQEIKSTDLTKKALAIFLFLLILTALFASNKEARSRFSQVSILNDLDVSYELSRMPFEEGPNRVFVARLFHNKPSVYARRFINEYANYFSANFLVGNVAKPLRYTTPGIGMLTYFEAFLFLLGLISIAQKRHSILPLFLLLIAPVPAALTMEDSPNLHRALFMLPFISIIAAYGFYQLKQVKRFKKEIIFATSLGLALNFIFFLHMYFVHAKVHIPLYRNIGAKELALELNKLQKDYDKIVLTNIPDDPYPWIAFFTGRDPKIFNKDAIMREKGTWTSENFVFTGLRCPSRDAFEEPDVKRLLVVDAEGCASESNLKSREDVIIYKQIKRPDQSEVYTLWSKTE